MIGSIRDLEQAFERKLCSEESQAKVTRITVNRWRCLLVSF